jgi:hypothetical protein
VPRFLGSDPRYREALTPCSGGRFAGVNFDCSAVWGISATANCYFSKDIKHNDKRVQY